jgi:hypothetical protein
MKVRLTRLNWFVALLSLFVAGVSAQEAPLTPQENLVLQNVPAPKWAIPSSSLYPTWRQL